MEESIRMNVDISVILPVYNAEEYLVDSIESILSQSFTNFELIIINDGSTDSSEQIIADYMLADARIICISRENKGLVTSLNEGLSIASGGLIARMDADDIALPKRLQKQYEFLQENQDVLCVGSSVVAIDQDGDELIELNVPTQYEKIESLLLSGHCPIEHPTVMFRKAEVIEVGAYRVEYETAEDYDLWLRLSEQGSLMNISEPLLKYRYLDTSISAIKSEIQYEKTKQACEDAWRRRGVAGEFALTEPWRKFGTRELNYRQAIKFGWWSYKYKNKRAALKYAIKAIKILPHQLSGWKLLVVSFIKLRNLDA